MKAIINKTILLAIACFIGFNASAQNNDSLLRDNQITVIKNFKPILSDAIKIPVNPNPEKPEYVKPIFTYDVAAKQYMFEPTIYTIKPLSMGTMLLPKLKGNYMKVGFGNNLTPVGEIYLNTVRNKQLQAGVFLKHLSSNGDLLYNNFSNNTIHTYVKKYGDKSNLGLEAYYHRNKINLYGYPNTDKKLPEDPSIVYHLYDVKSHSYNVLRDSSDKLSYRTDAGFYHFNNNSSFKENDAGLKVQLRKTISTIPFELISGIRLNNNAVKDSSANWNSFQRIYFDLNPQLFMTSNEFYLKGGFNSTISSDSAGSQFHFYPKAEGAYYIIPNKLTVFAGFTGNLKPVTYRNIITENPFVTNISLLNTNTKIEVYGGLKGELGPQTNYKITSSSASVDNLVTFVQDSFSNGQTLLYETEKAKLTTLSFELQHQMNEKFRFGLYTAVYGYELKTLKRAYSLPLFETKINATYNIGDKFMLKLDMFYWGERYSRIGATDSLGNYQSKEIKLNPFVDLNFGIDYRYSKNLSAFLNFNNIANNKYQKYFTYPVYGINILGGFTFTF
jgi:hypothetical protein